MTWRPAPLLTTAFSARAAPLQLDNAGGGEGRRRRRWGKRFGGRMTGYMVGRGRGYGSGGSEVVFLY